MASNPTSVLNYFITPKCYDKFFIENQLETECMKSVISKCLGYMIVLGSILVKVPQILKILKANSAEGLSLFGIILELIAVTGTLAYSYANSFPFSAYGDAAFMTIQQAIILFLVFFYNINFMSAIIYMSMYGVVVGYLLSPQVSTALLTLLQTSVVALVVISRLSQALTNYQNKGSGQLSFLTVVLQFAGASVRILTSLHETGDMITIVMYIASTFTNAILLMQILHYWNVPSTFENIGNDNDVGDVDEGAVGGGGSGGGRSGGVGGGKKEN